jgi:hypothetical protein
VTDLVTLIIQRATINRLEMECGPIDRDVQQLVAEMEHLSAAECRRGGFPERFMELLRRRGEIARAVLVKPKHLSQRSSAARRQLSGAVEAGQPRPLALASTQAMPPARPWPSWRARAQSGRRSIASAR